MLKQSKTVLMLVNVVQRQFQQFQLHGGFDTAGYSAVLNQCEQGPTCVKGANIIQVVMNLSEQ